MGGFEIKKSDQPILEHCFSILDSPFRDKIPLKKCYMWCVLQYGRTTKFRKSFYFYQNGIKMLYLLLIMCKTRMVKSLTKLFNIDLLDFDYYKSLIQRYKRRVKFEKPTYFHRLYIPTHVRILFNQVKCS